MGCRSINVLRLGLGMFSMNLSLSCNKAAREAKQSEWHCCWFVSIYAGAVSSSCLACSYLTTSSIYQIKQMDTTEYVGLLTNH